MPNNNDNKDEQKIDSQSPFHQGETECQIRAGVSNELTDIAKVAITPFMRDTHQYFLTNLSMLFVAAEDKEQNIWSSFLTDERNFIQIIDNQNLILRSMFLDVDPLSNQLEVGSDIGILGIQFETRRRIRVNAKIKNLDSSEISLNVKQCYGNCPKYIQLRTNTRFPANEAPQSILVDRIDSHLQGFIKNTDSLFIASQNKENEEKNNTGFDSSHRGGMPGFVKVPDDKTILIPDYIGNNFFNTIGNLLNNPKMGLQLLDYENGHRIMLTGTAEVIWAEDQTLPFDGVDRMIKFTLKHGYLLKNSLPFKWEFKAYSPFSKAYSGEKLDL